MPGGLERERTAAVRRDKVDGSAQILSCVPLSGRALEGVVKPGMADTKVGILVDYESPLAREVAGKVWSGISAMALASGHDKCSALWDGLGGIKAYRKLSGVELLVFVIGQDRPYAVDSIGVAEVWEDARLYGTIVAVPERPSPLAGPLLYQGVERLTEGGTKARKIEPAMLRSMKAECEAYANRLLERLTNLRTSTENRKR